MTNPLTTPLTSPVLVRDSPAWRPGLTAADAERMAIALDAELAASTRGTYVCAWRQWASWCRQRSLAALPATPEALAAFLTERAEAGLSYGTLD